MLTHGGNTLVFSNNNITTTSGKPYGGPKRGPGRPRKDILPGNRIVKDGRIIIKKVRSGNIHKFPMKRKFLPTIKDEKNNITGTGNSNNNNGTHVGLSQESGNGNGSNNGDNNNGSNGLYSSLQPLPPKSPSESSLANENGNSEGNSNNGDKTPSQSSEELPYFPERW